MARNIAEILKEILGVEKVFTANQVLKERRHDTWPLSILDDMQGRPAPMPGCVVQPTETADVVAVVNACRENRTPLVPFGLGSGVCGGVRVDAAMVLLDMGNMKRVRLLDKENLLATFEAGLRGADAEVIAAKQGLTMGHFPQSIDISTVGGWVATRSAGQFSTAYGNIEDVVAGLEVVLPSGKLLVTRQTPRASTGPDLKNIFIGSEGTLGVITAVTFSLRWKPEKRAVSAYYAPDMDRGFELQRFIIQSDWRPPVMRQYDFMEVKRNFPEQTRGTDALIVMVHEGPASRVDLEKKACFMLAAEMSCDPAPEETVHRWLEERNHVTGFEPLMEKGIIVDTIEVAATWDRIGSIYKNVIRSLGVVEGIRTASSHSSHCYRSGLNLYFTFAAKPVDRAKMAPIYNECWRRTMEETLAAGGEYLSSSRDRSRPSRMAIPRVGGIGRSSPGRSQRHPRSLPHNESRGALPPWLKRFWQLTRDQRMCMPWLWGRMEPSLASP